MTSRLIESDFSPPFVIITNSVQWRDSEGMLLKTELFGEATEVSWAKFANMLQLYYLVPQFSTVILLRKGCYKAKR